MELLTPSSYAAGRLKVRYTPINGDWFIENKSSDIGNVKADSTYGTKRASAYRIIEDTLNLRDTRIFDYVYDEHGNKKAVFNAKETTAAQAKQEVIEQAFQDWIWKDPERRNRLVRYYNDTFNSKRPREYDGRHQPRDYTKTPPSQRHRPYPLRWQHAPCPQGRCRKDL